MCVCTHSQAEVCSGVHGVVRMRGSRHYILAPSPPRPTIPPHMYTCTHRYRGLSDRDNIVFRESNYIFDLNILCQKLPTVVIFKCKVV